MDAQVEADLVRFNPNVRFEQMPDGQQLRGRSRWRGVLVRVIVRAPPSEKPPLP